MFNGLLYLFISSTEIIVCRFLHYSSQPTEQPFHVPPPTIDLCLSPSRPITHPILVHRLDENDSDSDNDNISISAAASIKTMELCFEDLDGDEDIHAFDSSNWEQHVDEGVVNSWLNDSHYFVLAPGVLLRPPKDGAKVTYASSSKTVYDGTSRTSVYRKRKEVNDEKAEEDAASASSKKVTDFFKRIQVPARPRVTEVTDV